jgi:hypothetical protein
MKKVLAAFTFAILVFELSFVCLPVQGTDIGGIISSDTTWTAADNPYMLTKNTLVAKGATLRIEPGVEVYIKEDCYLQINGTIIARGTESSKIYFASGEIRFLDTPAYNEQTGEGSLLDNCAFTAKLDQQVSVKFCAPKISNSIFYNQLFLGDSGAIISGNVFNGPVRVSGGSNIFTHNTFKQGIKFVSGKNLNAQILENTFTGYINGVAINVDINDLNACYSLKIEKNLISNNHQGILVTTLISPTMRYNTIINNDIGIDLLNHQGQTYVIKFNTLINQRNLDVGGGVFGTPDVDATNNWWGTTDTNQIDESIYDFNDNFNCGKVLYTPFLTGPDPNAPETSDVPTFTPVPTPTASTPQNSPTPTQTPDLTSFNIESNSTISAFYLDNDIPQISFYVNGPDGTTGYVKINIAKSFMPNADTIQVLLDGNQVNRDITSNDDTWTVTFTYHHSSHQVTINTTENPSETGVPDWIWNAATFTVAVSVAASVCIILWLAKKNNQT